MGFGSYDFGYSWPFTHGHLIPALVFGALTFLAWRYKWPRWTAALSAVIALWGIAGFFIVQFAARINQPVELPTAQFLTSGSGRVLDAGAGSGRATLMVLLSRPGSRVVALDKFLAGYGIEDNSPRRLEANMRAAGVADRVEVKTGDVREMPLESGSFDAAVSTYVIDHLNREGMTRSLAEMARVLRPGGEFLLMVINRDDWVRVAYPFLHGHGYFGQAPAADRWRARLETAGFEIVEQGTRPMTLFFLSRKK